MILTIVFFKKLFERVFFFNTEKIMNKKKKIKNKIKNYFYLCFFS